ncbi:MAG: hypothetical protein J0L56_00350 [Chitinophagales bacterium]|nr:hypothetical protein [Chitinophagales bacterium]
MKKLFFTSLLLVILLNRMQAQEMSIRVDNNSKESSNNDGDKTLVTGSDGSTASINDIHVKAVRDFLKACKKAESSHWYIDADGFFVYYLNEGNRARRFYDKKGNFIYSILFYPGHFLSADIKDKVKSTYYLDYTITRVEEVFLKGETIYFVHIEDPSCFKILRISGSEMETISEMFK